MDLSFINVPTSQDELLGLLQVAYKAGQDSIGTKFPGYVEACGNVPVIKTKKYSKANFKQWLSRLATQWEDMKHS